MKRRAQKTDTFQEAAVSKNNKMKTENTTEKSRATKVRQLLDEREQLFPNESFDDRWAAVMMSSKGRALYNEMSVSSVGYGGIPLSYPSEQDEQRRTAEAAGKITDEPKLKEEGRRGFLADVSRLQAAGHEYSQAWSIASSSSPGKEFYAQWARGAAQLKPGA